MARNTKAKKQASNADIGAEIFASLRDLEKVKGIPMDYMLDRLKQALTNAYRKDKEGPQEDDFYRRPRKEEAPKAPEENVVVDISESGLFMHVIKTAVDTVEDPKQEILIDAARNYDSKAQVGDSISIPVDIQKFGRIAATAAKQVIIQGIREAESGKLYDSYSSKAQELLTGVVHQIDPATGDVYVTLGQGSEQSEAVLRASEQIPGEIYTPGQRVRVYVLGVHRAMRGPMVHVSRTHPNVVRQLFLLETPEIADGLVELRNIAREAGSRSKIAVRAVDENVDPVGACVGPRGGRVGAVVEELGGEKIDIVVWSEDPCEYVKAALSPAEAISVDLIPGQKACRVVVPDDQLSLAIGKEGQNARLAARLTGYKIDIKPASAADEEAL